MRFGDLHPVHVDALSKPPLRLIDLDVVTAHLSLAHLAILGKGPVFETVTSHPLARFGVLELIPELHGNLVVTKGEQFLAEAVLLFYRPLLGQEFYDVFGAAKEVVSVAPDAIRGISL